MTENKKALGRSLRRWLETAGLKARPVHLLPGEREFLEAVFVPQHYARVAGLNRLGRLAPFRHYLRHGLALNLSPTPLFDNAVFQALTGGTSTGEAPDILRWYRDFRLEAIAPTVHFDPDHYLALYTDVLDAGVGAYEHYLLYGVREERQPNALFDPRWYEAVADRQTGEQDLPGQLHYLIYGLERGTPPNAALLAAFTRTPTVRLDPLGFLERVEAAIAPWRSRLKPDQLRMLLLLFHPDTYSGDGQLPDDSSGLARLEHFLAHGIEAGLDPGPLFSAEFYAKAAGLSDGRDVSPLLHFLEIGKERRIVPTPMFDEGAYAQAWQDIARVGTWGFAHFLEHGVFEGRQINVSEPRLAAPLPPHSALARFHNWELFWKEAGFGRVEHTVGQPDAPTATSEALDGIAERDLQVVRALFVPHYYALEAGLDVELSHEQLLDHYLRHGMHGDLAPGPFFDPAIARTLTRTRGQSALLAWLKGRQPSWPAPTALVDLEFYGARYPELKSHVSNLFEHYLLHGLSENRAPTWAFDPEWYTEAHDHPTTERQMPAYLHYILHGVRRGLAPSRILLTTFDGSDDENLRLDGYKAVCNAGAAWLRKLGADKLQVMLAMFSPYTYDGGGSLPETAPGPARLAHFLERGVEAGLAPSPLFDANIYRADHPVTGDLPFLDYLRKGWPKRQVPTSLFSEEAYQSAHADIRSHGIWGFKHFLFHGLFEGRAVDDCPRLAVPPTHGSGAAQELINAQLFWVANGVRTSQLRLNRQVGRAQHRVNLLLRSAEMASTIAQALALEPAIGDIRRVEGVYAAPVHDVAHLAMSRLHDCIPDLEFGTIICIPWLRVGGADLVACQLAQAVHLAKPHEPVLLLRVDHDKFDRPDWVPDGVIVADVSQVLKTVDENTGERLLFTLMQALKPKRVINVNSLRTWRMFDRFGQRLQPYVNLYSYLFCWDQTADGYRLGYPSMFYPTVAGVIKGIFTDTAYLRDELLRIYSPPPQVAERTKVLHTPSRTPTQSIACARISAQSASARRPLVLWGGRLDRQKRFDLVQQIARRMPHVDFLCWGDAVLESPPDQRASPPNLTLKPGFRTYSELPFQDATLWLFTSAWEGMPTILIEIAIRGMAVVASQVGGVPELVNEETGFPVFEVNNIDAYVAAVQDCIDDPDRRIARAERLMAKAAKLYSQESYVRDLTAIFACEN